MIIECKNCLKKFVARDSDIPANGRIVKCSNCSTQWLQMPFSSPVTKINLDEDKDISVNKFTASDGKTYTFLGNQWAEIHSTGKTGKLAKKKISNELNKLTGKNKKILTKKNLKMKANNDLNQLPDQYQEKEEGGMGIFSFLIVFIICIVAIILFLDTFKNQIIPFWPNLNNYLVYVFETLNNIYIIIQDLFNKYK